MLILSCQTCYWNNIFLYFYKQVNLLWPSGKWPKDLRFPWCSFCEPISVYFKVSVFFLFFWEVGGVGVTLLAIGIHRRTERWNSRVFLIKGSQQTQQKVVLCIISSILGAIYWCSGFTNSRCAPINWGWCCRYECHPWIEAFGDNISTPAYPGKGNSNLDLGLCFGSEMTLLDY